MEFRRMTFKLTSFNIELQKQHQNETKQKRFEWFLKGKREFMFSGIWKEFFILMRFVKTLYFSHVQCFDKKKYFFTGSLKNATLNFGAYRHNKFYAVCCCVLSIFRIQKSRKNTPKMLWNRKSIMLAWTATMVITACEHSENFRNT